MQSDSCSLHCSIKRNSVTSFLHALSLKLHDSWTEGSQMTLNSTDRKHRYSSVIIEMMPLLTWNINIIKEITSLFIRMSLPLSAAARRPKIFLANTLKVKALPWCKEIWTNTLILFKGFPYYICFQTEIVPFKPEWL